MDVYYQWASATSPVDVFGDILYTNQCETTSPPNADESQDLKLILGVSLGGCAVVATIFCCAFLIYCIFCKNKKKQVQRQQRQNAINEGASSGRHIEVISEQYVVYHGHENNSSSPPTYAEAEKMV